MKNKVIRAAAGAAVVLFFSCGLTFAKTSHVNLIYLGKAGQLTLPPGSYRVKVNTTSTTPEMAFYQNGKLIGTTPVRVVTKSSKNSQTQIYYNAPKDNVRRITQIDLNGWKDKLLFKPAAATRNHMGESSQTSSGT
ncbi:MAG TPA: hypothetical protein VMI06_17735 [Terriglobia bacterium]|nr:hypothetical protein [Terriglobia bacterium]